MAGLTGLFAGWSAHNTFSGLSFSGIRALAGLKPLAISTPVPQATATVSPVSESVPRATAALRHPWTPHQLLIDAVPANKYVRVPVSAVYFSADIDALLRAASAPLSAGSATPTVATAAEKHIPPRVPTFNTLVRLPVVEIQATPATIVIITAVQSFLFARFASTLTRIPDFKHTVWMFGSSYDNLVLRCQAEGPQDSY